MMDDHVDRVDERDLEKEAHASAASPRVSEADSGESRTPQDNEKAAATPEDTPEDVPEDYQLTQVQLATLGLALAMLVFLLALDEAIISTAIPRITDQFDSLADVGWYGSGYLMTMACIQLTFGKLYKHLPSKWVLLSALLIFELGSAVSGASPSSNALIVGRVISGMGAGGIVSGALIIISQVVPLRQRAIYTSAVGSIYGLAAACGPLVGGPLTDSHLTWRWCFYINLPLGAVAGLAIFFLYRPPPEKTEKLDSVWQLLKNLDPLGLAVFAGAIICLILSLQTSGIDGWNSVRPIALAVSAAVFLALFAGVQMWLQEAGTLPPRIARMRQVIFACFYALTIDCSYYVIAYFLPIWFQAVDGTSAQTSGIRLLPIIISSILTSLVVGWFVSKTRIYSPIVILSGVLASIGGGLFTTLQVNSGIGPWFGYQLIVGIGVGAGMQMPVLVVQDRMEPADIPTAISVTILAQSLGSALMVSVAQNIFAQRLFVELRGLDPDLTRAEVILSGATDILKLAPATDGQYMLWLDAVNAALVSAFYVSAVCGALAVVFSLGLGFRRLQ